MKKLLLALVLFLAPSLAWAQCTGAFPNNTVCGNTSGSTATPKASAFSAGAITYTPPGVGARTLSQSDVNGFVVNLKWYAAGDGSDQTTAIQAAFTYAKSIAGSQGMSVFVPCGNYVVTGAIDITGISVFGEGYCSHIATTTNNAIFKINTDTAGVNHTSYRDIAFIGDVAGTRTSVAGIEISGTTAGNNFAYNLFSNINCVGTYRCIYFSKNVNSGGENEIDFNVFTGIQTTNNGAYNVDRAIDFANGSGTGNVFSNSAVVVGSYGLIWQGTNGANIGDITISNFQVSGDPAATCFHFSGTGAYRNNIAIGNSQCDGGPTTSLYALNYSNMHLSNNNWAGATTFNLVGTAFSSGGFYGDSKRRYGNYKASVASTTTDDFFTITLPTSGYAGIMLEITASGLVQSIGTQVRTSRYHIAENGACAGITAVELDTAAGGSNGTPFTFTSALATCTLTFTLNFPGGTGAGSTIYYSIEATGYSFDVALQ